MQFLRLSEGHIAWARPQAMDVVGGACRTEFPFSRAPDLGVSTGAYLLGLFPPELLQVALVRLVLHMHLVATTQ